MAISNRNVMGSRNIKKSIFKPKRGQVDFTRARWAPVINCVVRCRGKILLVQRSRKLWLYPGYWNGISGFLDDKKSLEEKVKAELKEELGMPAHAVKRVHLGEIFHQEAPQYKKTWIVHPVLVDVTTDTVKLDWEAEDYRWVVMSEVKKLKLLPGFGKVLGRLPL